MGFCKNPFKKQLNLLNKGIAMFAMPLEIDQLTLRGSSFMLG